MWRNPFTAKISPAAAMVKPTPPSAMRVSMSKPTHQPHGYAWLMLAIVARPVAKRTIVATTAATTRAQRTNETGRHQAGGSAVRMLVLLVIVVSPEAEAATDDHRDDGHGYPDRGEDLGGEVQQLDGQGWWGLVGQVGRVAELLERHRRQVQDGGAAHLVQAVDVRNVPAGRCGDPAARFRDHIVSLSERDGGGGAHLSARGVLSDLDAIGAERAFVNRGNDAIEVELRHHERAGLHAVPTADAAPGVEDHRSLRRLRQRGRRTRRRAGRLEAVHAEEPTEDPVGMPVRTRLDPGVGDHGVVVRVQVTRVLIARPGEEGARVAGQVVPGLTGHHARPAPDAPGVVLDHRLERHQTSPFRFTSHRKALNSGIIVLASPTPGVSRLPLSPRARPTHPQCHGTPIWWMVRPCTQNGSKRSVTRA